MLRDEVAEIIRQYAVDYDGDDQGFITADELINIILNKAKEAVVNRKPFVDASDALEQLKKEHSK